MPERVSRRRPVRRAREEEPEDEEEFDTEDDEEEEEERPRRRAARGVKSSTARPRRRSRDVDEEDDDEDEPSRRSSQDSKPVRKGWGGGKRVREQSSDFAEQLQIDDEAILIKFLEDEPFAAYRQHWIEGLKSTKKKSFTCLEDGCPLCDLGDRPSGKFCFNVLLLSEGEPVVKAWIVGSRVFSTLEDLANDSKKGPLSKLYYAVTKSGKGTKTNYNVQAVKERDLEEDWDAEPLDDKLLDHFAKDCYDESVIQVQTKKQLKEIARELADDDDDYDD